MRYLEITADFIDFTAFSKDLKRVFVEIDDKGFANREIAINDKEELVHVYPSINYEYGKYGLLDVASIDVGDVDDNIKKWFFEELWYKHLQSLKT